MSRCWDHWDRRAFPKNIVSACAPDAHWTEEPEVDQELWRANAGWSPIQYRKERSLQAVGPNLHHPDLRARLAGLGFWWPRVCRRLMLRGTRNSSQGVLWLLAVVL